MHKIRIQKTFLTMAGFLFAAQMASAETAVRLSVHGQEEVSHSLSKPVLFSLSVADGDRNNLETRNQQNARVVRAFSNTREFSAMSDEQRKELYARYPVKKPEPSAASRKARLTLTDAAGKPVKLSVRPLAVSAKEKDRILFSAESNGAVLFYGIDAAALKSLEEGDYTAVAVLDGARSNPVRIRFVNRDIAVTDHIENGSLYEEGLFYRVDQNWSELERVADALTATNAQSVDGWIFKGDALAGQGKRPEAINAFKKAREHASAKLQARAKDAEVPDYLLERLRQLREEASAATGKA